MRPCAERASGRATVPSPPAGHQAIVQLSDTACARLTWRVFAGATDTGQ